MNEIPWKADVWHTGTSRQHWTSKQVQEIVALKGRLSASKIGKRYGVTRNAICGLWFRAANGPGRKKARVASQIAEEGGE